MLMAPVDNDLSADQPTTRASSGPQGSGGQAGDLPGAEPPEKAGEGEARAGAAADDVAIPPVPDLSDLHDVDGGDALGRTLQALIERRGDRFDPVRFRFIQALAQSAARRRASVTALIEQRARRLLSGYIDDYRSARENAVSVLDEMATESAESTDQARQMLARGDLSGVARLAARRTVRDDGHLQALRALKAALQHQDAVEELPAERGLEDELRLQEIQLMQSLGAPSASASGAAGEHGQSGAATRVSATHRLRRSLRKHHLEQRVSRAIHDGPDDPGPLNAQALVIRSFSIMRALSPGYTDRFASYMDTLFWLEEAGRAAGRKKNRRAGKRKS